MYDAYINDQGTQDPFPLLIYGQILSQTLILDTTT